MPRAGSSPLTRGKQIIEGADPISPRLIPAHAGKTRRSTPLPTAMTAHPRSRGENLIPRDSMTCAAGSSPLPRGKRPQESVGTAAARLIPAHAGKTPLRRLLQPASRAHPRSRGENYPERNPSCPVPGSSPLTRGKHRVVGHVHDEVRLIPAHAGKTLVGVRRLVGGGGSSPLTRGKPPATKA